MQSRYIAKSARLHDLFTYLCDRVINEGTSEIHEQEVGHAVFGRPVDYDTALDNIVRVHASTLRKRLEQYFAEEGREEPVVIELPKGNYAPVFREREVPETAVAPIPAVPDPLPAMLPEVSPVIAPQATDRRVFVFGALAAIFACSTAFLLWRPAPAVTSLPPAVKDFWGSIFVPHQKADVVLDDAALGLYQEIDGRPIALSEYFDRSYLRRLREKPEASAILLKRQSSYANAGLLWQLSHTAAALNSDWAVHFARDYAFRELKANRSVLLGTGRSNPWIEPFENKIGIRWAFDSVTGNYYPVDSWAGADQAEKYRASGDHPDGYASVALLPNLGATGNVLIVSCTGGAATTSAGAFLVDEERMEQLRSKLPAGKSGEFPQFAALLKFTSHSRLPKDVEIVFCRTPRK